MIAKLSEYALLTIILFVFSLVVLEGLARETERIQAVKAYDCAHYGNAMNADYCVMTNPPQMKGVK
jgi:hypothetical protein